jgi:hypothetical protein
MRRTVPAVTWLTSQRMSALPARTHPLLAALPIVLSAFVP